MPQFIQKSGGEKVTLESLGFKSLQDAANQGYNPVSAPTSAPVSTTDLNNSQNFISESKRAADILVPNKQALDFYSERGLIESDLRREGDRIYIKSDSPFAQMAPPKEVAMSLPAEEKKEKKEEPPQTGREKITDFYKTLGDNLSAFKGQAKEEAGVAEKQAAASDAARQVSEMQTSLSNQGILNLKAQKDLVDDIESQVIPMVEINKQIGEALKDMTFEQKINTMIMQNNLMNAQQQLAIAQNDFRYAEEVAKDSSEDFYRNQMFMLEAYRTEVGMEGLEYERNKEMIDYERKLAEKGFVHIPSLEQYQGMILNQGFAEEDFFTDPANGRKYLKSDPELSFEQARALGVPIGTTWRQARKTGITPRYKGSGSGSGGSVAEAIDPLLETQAEMYLRGESLGNVGADKKAQIVQRANELRNSIEYISGLVGDASAAGDTQEVIKTDLLSLGFDPGLVDEALNVLPEDLESDEQGRGFFSQLFKFTRPTSPLGGGGGGSF